MSLPFSARPRRPTGCAAPAPRRSTLRAVTLCAMTFVLATLSCAAAFADPAAPDSASATRRVLLPLIRGGGASGVSTGASYRAIPVQPPPTDRPAAKHADLNLSMRGYSKTSASLALVDYGGDTDGGAPQMPGIFVDHRTPKFTSVYRVYEWNWGCGGDGCRGSPITSPPVTLLGMGTKAGELLAAPYRSAEIYGGGYVALVPYADERRITLKYTHDDNVVGGYTVHLENLNVDGNLLSLYRRNDAAGRGELPGITNGQPVGVASGSEVLVAIRDCGAFLDPRSRKDWWQGR